VVFGGAPADIVARLENITNGGSETLTCGEEEITIDGSDPAVREVASGMLQGAYLSQLGPIALAPDIRDPEQRAEAVCSALLARATDSQNTSELRRAAAEAYVEGNKQKSILPPQFTYECVARDVAALQAVTDAGDVLADAAVDVLARLWAHSGADLRALAQTGASAQTRLAASLALGIENAESGADIRTAVNYLRTPLEAAATIMLARGWAGRPLDIPGVCVYARGLNDCIIVR